jgi:hypothetical protein
MVCICRKNGGQIHHGEVIIIRQLNPAIQTTILALQTALQGIAAARQSCSRKIILDI